jgi:hypothetical protein
MGYPVLTRLGLNQFWYKNWYSDANFKSNLKHDKIFLELLKFYLNYGLTFTNNVFFNEYFFNKKLKNLRLSNLITNNKFFRKFFFSNDVLGIEHSYFLRYKTSEYFPFRIWIIKYSNWIIINFCCYKPVKGSSKSKSKIKKEYSSINPTLFYRNSNPKFTRYKLLFVFFRKYFYKNYNYCF